MARDRNTVSEPIALRGLVVGNYCHDVLMKDGIVLAETLGGATSFIAAVLDGMGIQSNFVSKVGTDFAYDASNVIHRPIISETALTTLFHAHFQSGGPCYAHGDRVLKRIHACEAIFPSDIPELKYDFGMAVGVGGEIVPETLERILDICDVVLVDIQALIRVFDSGDGTVKLVGLEESGFSHLVPRIGFLKASAEEAPYLDVEEARKRCCVVVTNGKEGCTIYWKDKELRIEPFPAEQVDPTGAGDSFLGGFVAGLVQGLSVPDAALLGNFFGSLTVGHIGLPKLDSRLLERVKEDVQKRKGMNCCERKDGFKIMESSGHEHFHASLCAARVIPSMKATGQDVINAQYARPHQFLLNHVYEEPIPSLEGKPLKPC